MAKPEHIGTCEQCNWYVPIFEERGQCRRVLPVALVRQQTGRSGGDRITGAWPPVGVSEWCAEYAGPNPNPPEPVPYTGMTNP